MATPQLIKVERPDKAIAPLQALFHSFEFSAAMIGLLEGVSPGFVFVDDLAHPRTGVASTAEGVYLAGRASDPSTQETIRSFFAQELLSGRLLVKSPTDLYLSVFPEAWAAHLNVLVPYQEIHATPRYHYLCTAACLDWRSHVPEGYSIRPLDRELLRRDNVHDLLAHQLPTEQLWGSVDQLIHQAVGFAALKNDEVVSWCTPDCVGGGRIDFACATHPAHRLKGLASIVTAASVQAAFERGFRAAGWMCAASNEASWRTAERVGFVRQGTYTEYFYRATPVAE